jgi:hypothetical protein
MTYVSFLGGLMTTFSLPAVLVVVSVWKYPFLVLICLAGAFFWIVGASLKASLWMAFQDNVWGTIATGVVIDAGCRLLFAWAFLKIRPKLLLLMAPNHRDDVQKTMNARSASLVGGLGYGTIQAITVYGLVLSESTGPATYYLESCPNVSIFLLQSVVALSFLLMAPFLQYAAMHAVYHRQWLHLLCVVGFHGFASFCSVASSSSTPGLCGVSVGGALVGVVGSAVYSACVLHRSAADELLSTHSSRAKLL